MRKVTVPTKESQENGEGTRDVTFEKPKLKPVPRKEIDIPKKNKIPLPKLNSITDATENNPLGTHSDLLFLTTKLTPLAVDKFAYLH